MTERQLMACAIYPPALSTLLGIKLDEWQADFLLTMTASDAPSGTLLNIHRQGGKSFVLAVLAIWTITYIPASLVIIVAPKLAQAKETYRKALRLYRAMGKPLGVRSVTTESLELEHASRLLTLPDTETGRGYSSVTLYIEDEASRLSDSTYYSQRPALAVSGGRMVLAGTPAGKQGHFYEEWANGEGWRRFEVPATECPRIDPAWLQQERRAMTEDYYAQEYECAFRSSIGSVFAAQLVEAMIDDTLQPLFITPMQATAPARGARTVTATGIHAHDFAPAERLSA